MNKPIPVGLAMKRSCSLTIGWALLLLIFPVFRAHAQTVTNIHLFSGAPSDGSNPYARLIQASDGNFYGTTQQGGTSGSGMVFRISPNGSYTNLHSFSSIDGAIPLGLVEGRDGNFYGITEFGGTNINCFSGCGTIFRINSSGNFTSLYSFAGLPNDGSDPGVELVEGRDGNFYGTTAAGGPCTSCGRGLGTIFRISPSGSYTSLYSFVGSPTDGSIPLGALVQGSDGNLYGTTYSGGTNGSCFSYLYGSGCGTIFRIGLGGTYTSLYSFVDSRGLNPRGSLVQGSDGYFYGTTVNGQSMSSYGTVFRFGTDGSFTNLHYFTDPTKGVTPFAGLVQGSDGNFYGTTDGDANFCQCGTIFQISPAGSYKQVYAFPGPTANGPGLYDRLTQGTDGSFYGTTYTGGTLTNSPFGLGNGIVFKLTVSLKPAPYPINQITGVQLSGTNVVFNIPSIAYETYQLQFSSSMNPTNWVNVPSVSVTNSIGATLTLTNFGGASSQGFYRFDITP